MLNKPSSIWAMLNALGCGEFDAAPRNQMMTLRPCIVEGLGVNLTLPFAHIMEVLAVFSDGSVQLALTLFSPACSLEPRLALVSTPWSS